MNELLCVHFLVRIQSLHCQRLIESTKHINTPKSCSVRKIVFSSYHCCCSFPSRCLFLVIVFVVSPRGKGDKEIGPNTIVENWFESWERKEERTAHKSCLKRNKDWKIQADRQAGRLVVQILYTSSWRASYFSSIFLSNTIPYFKTTVR